MMYDPRKRPEASLAERILGVVCVVCVGAIAIAVPTLIVAAGCDTIYVDDEGD